MDRPARGAHAARLPPARLQDGAGAHPLAIFFDGQNMFDDEGSYQGGWQLHRLLDWRACRGGRVPIAVALDTAGWSRASVLTPWPRAGVEGLGARTIEWLSSWLIPTLRAELRVEPGPDAVLIGGASLGGLLALYAYAQRPDQFGRVMAMSPALGWPDGGAPVIDLIASAPRHRRGRVYVDAGARECECTNIVRHTGALVGTLERLGYRHGHDLAHWHDPDGAHDEPSWKRRLPAALDFLLD